MLQRLLILRRFCAIFACINMMRAFCVAVTSLPDASPMCISQFDSERRGRYKAMPIFPKCVFALAQVVPSCLYFACMTNSCLLVLRVCLCVPYRAFDRAWKVLVRPSQHITCGDMVFSGHTVFFVLCAMTVKTVRTWRCCCLLLACC